MNRFSFRPQLESLDGRVLPSVTPAIAVGEVAHVAPSSIPQPLTVTITKGFGDFTPGTFIASEGIADSGVYQLLDAHDAALPSPVVGTGHDTFTLTGTRGTITMKSETVFRVVSFDPLVFGQDGHWRIVSGTGDYAKLKGEGEYHKLIDVALGQITITLTGRVHSGPFAFGGNGLYNGWRDPGNAADHAGAFRSQDMVEEMTLILAVDLDAGSRTWSASGAIDDNGTAATVSIRFAAFGAPTKSVLLIDTLFTNADGTGTFTIRRTIVSTADGQDWVREGAWHVVDATGIYADLSGHGTLSGTESGAQVVDTLTGVLRITN